MSSRVPNRNVRFVAGVVAVSALGWLWPDPGGPGSPLPLEILKPAGVMAIFLLQGLMLKPEVLRRGAGNVRLHACCLSATYVVFPLLTGLMLLATGGWMPPDLRAGFWLMAFLPTTVASAVAFTATARGDVAGALFQCAVSNVLGVFITPLAVMWILSTGTGEVLRMDPLRRVGLLVLLPLLAGQLFRPIVGSVVGRHASWAPRISSWIILFLLWTAVCGNATRAEEDAFGWMNLLLTAAVCAVLLGGMAGLILLAAPRMGLDRGGRIAAVFCGTQKTLAMGLPLAGVLFVDAPYTPGLLLLPLIVYHPLQLLAGGLFIAGFRE